MTYENHLKRINSADVLRFFESPAAGKSNLFSVQRINDFGRRDRRCKIREKRDVLFRSKDRAEAVAFFNKYLEEHKQKCLA